MKKLKFLLYGVAFFVVGYFGSMLLSVFFSNDENKTQQNEISLSPCADKSKEVIQEYFENGNMRAEIACLNNQRNGIEKILAQDKLRGFSRINFSNFL